MPRTRKVDKLAQAVLPDKPARLVDQPAAAVPALASVLEDGNRYVVGYAIEALERIATPDAITVLLPFLKTARWCPITNSGSLF